MTRVPPAPAEHPMQWDEWVGATDAPLGCCYHTPGVGFCQDFPVVAWRWLPCAKWGASVRSPEWRPVCRKHAHGRVSWPTAAQCRAAGQPHRRPTAKPKGPTRTQLRRRCDEAFAAFIRGTGTCAVSVCGGHGQPVGACLGPLQCAHIVSRAYDGTRWDPLNALALCRRHHLLFTRNPLMWEMWRDAEIGYDLYCDLRRWALQHGGPTNYEEVLAEIARLASAVEVAS